MASRTGHGGGRGSECDAMLLELRRKHEVKSVKALPARSTVGLVLEGAVVNIVVPGSELPCKRGRSADSARRCRGGHRRRGGDKKRHHPTVCWSVCVCVCKRDISGVCDLFFNFIHYIHSGMHLIFSPVESRLTYK